MIGLSYDVSTAGGQSVATCVTYASTCVGRIEYVSIYVVGASSSVGGSWMK